MIDWETLRLKAHLAPWHFGIEFLLVQPMSFNQPKPLVLPGPLTLIEAPEMHVPIEPTFRLSMQSAQQLIDDLWHAGLRPTAGKSSEGLVEAKQQHINDLRTILFQEHGIGEK
jgi:hypothetical protein